MKTIDKSTFNNSWYKPGGSPLKRIVWYYINLIFFVNPYFPFYGLKARLLKAFGAKVGKRPVIKPGVNIKYPWLLELGDYVSIGENVWIDNLGKVMLGDHTTISQGAMLLTGNHNYKSTSFDLIVKEINLHHGVWIGAQATVCPGITCKSHSILTVGSVATADLESYGIYQGNPAIKIKNRQIN
ncbi:MAG: WcaF family extracellular polysaccharide biosynthesis acetyltransferase [Cyclobacteriaceae bacterium]